MTQTRRRESTQENSIKRWQTKKSAPEWTTIDKGYNIVWLPTKADTVSIQYYIQRLDTIERSTMLHTGHSRERL